MTEYQGVVGILFVAMKPLAAGGSEAEVVAEVIYQAATDGTDQLRYTAGADAEQIAAARKAADDATFLKSVKERFGL